MVPGDRFGFREVVRQRGQVGHRDALRAQMAAAAGDRADDAEQDVAGEDGRAGQSRQWAGSLGGALVGGDRSKEKVRTVRGRAAAGSTRPVNWSVASPVPPRRWMSG